LVKTSDMYSAKVRGPPRIMMRFRIERSRGVSGSRVVGEAAALATSRRSSSLLLAGVVAAA
jgi:hypothetical protein